jgi:hypothetical protein
MLQALSFIPKMDRQAACTILVSAPRGAVWPARDKNLLLVNRCLQDPAHVCFCEEIEEAA